MYPPLWPRDTSRSKVEGGSKISRLLCRIFRGFAQLPSSGQLDPRTCLVFCLFVFGFVVVDAVVFTSCVCVCLFLVFLLYFFYSIPGGRGTPRTATTTWPSLRKNRGKNKQIRTLSIRTLVVRNLTKYKKTTGLPYYPPSSPSHWSHPCLQNPQNILRKKKR